MAVGVAWIGGNWYYFHEDGAMNTGDVTLGETECRFGVDGVFKSATRVENTGGGAFRVGCYDEMTQALFDQLNEEKTEEYFEEYSEREDEYDGDMKRSYDRNATFQVYEDLNRAAMHRLEAAGRPVIRTAASRGGNGKRLSEIHLLRLGPERHGAVPANCEDDSDAYDKFRSKMMDRYDQKADRKYLPEYYRKIGIAHREEGGKHFFLIIMLR